MNMVKSYCIIIKGKCAYFPIKAKIGPYRRAGKLKIGYLAGMPNFFGGTVESGQNIYSTLINEVHEESQENIEIRLKEAELENICKKLYEFSQINQDGTIQTDYYFYSVNADINPSSVDIANFGNSYILKLSTDDKKWEDKYREMSCILKIPLAQLKKNIDDFLSQCIGIGGK